MPSQYDFWTVFSKMRIDEDLREINAYLTSFGTHLESLENDFGRRVDEYKNSPPEQDEWGHYADQFADEAMRLGLFGRILQNMALATLCSYFELTSVTLTRDDFHRREREEYQDYPSLCDAAKKRLGRFEDLDTYWKSHSLAYNQGPLWQEITDIRKVRHKILHTNGLLGDDGTSTRIRAYVLQRERDGRQGLAIEDNMIAADPVYCEEAAGVFRRFLVQLVEGVAAIKR